MKLKFILNPLLKKIFESNLAKNSFWSSLSMPLSGIFGILQIGFSARILGPEGFGIIGLITAITAAISSFLIFQNSTTITTYAIKEKEQGRNQKSLDIISYCTTFDFLSSCVAYLVLLMGILFIPGIFKIDSEYLGLIAVFGLSMIFSSIYWDLYAILQMFGKLNLNFISALIQSALKTIIVIVFYYLKCGTKEMILLLTFLPLISNIVLFHFCFKIIKQNYPDSKIKFTLKLNIDKEIKAFKNFGYGQKILKGLNRYIDVLILGAFAGTTEIGFFRAGKQMSGMLYMPISGYISSLYPEYSRYWHLKQFNGLKKLVFFSLLISCILTILCFLFFYFFGDLFIRLVLGVQFIEAKNIISILIIGTFISLAVSPLTFLPSMSGNPKPATISAAIGLISLIAAMIILAPVYGSLGVAYASIISTTGSLIVIIPSSLRILFTKKI